ncbi:MAG TPA: hypothetical protein VGG16_27115 [Streptosporangiaceae bacterium]
MADAGAAPEIAGVTITSGVTMTSGVTAITGTDDPGALPDD